MRTKKGGYRKSITELKKLLHSKQTEVDFKNKEKRKSFAEPNVQEITIIPTFDQFYKAPYRNDFGIVHSSNNNWAWTFKGYMNDESHQGLVMRMVSGEIPGRLDKSRLEHEGGEIFFTKDRDNGEIGKKMIMQIRGWGGLTGTGGGLGLDPEVACKIQDDFCDWLIEKISK